MKRLSSSILLSILLSGCAITGTSPVIAPAVAISVHGDETERIDRFIAEEMENRRIAGLSALVISGGQTLYAKGHGLADIERRTRVVAATPFLVASITKMFTAVGTMLLVEDGKVQLDAPIGTYVVDLPAHWRPLTIRQLLGVLSG